MTLSLCMIVKDEAETLPRCLARVTDLVDEVVVCDTGSTDNTVDVAKSLGAIVHTLPWTNDFAAARNAALDKVTGDWVLVLDADETLTDAGRALVQRVREGQPLGETPLDAVVLITLLRCELDAEQAPYSAVSRLFRRRPDLRFARPYHETVDDSVAALMQAEPQWQVVTVPEVAIDHRGYQPDAIAQRDKFQRAQTIMAAYLEQHPDDPYICNKLGALYGQAGEWETGRALLQQGLQQVQPEDPFTTYELHYHLGLADRAGDRLDEAEAHYRIALEQPIPDRLKLGAYINLGSLKKRQGDLLGAVDLFTKATEIAPDFAIAHYNLGAVQRARGYLDPAIAAYQTAIALQPTYAEAHQNLGVALFKLGKLPESVKSFQRAIAIYQHTDPEAARRLQANLRQLGQP
mgnify:CR=1 FL=1